MTIEGSRKVNLIHVLLSNERERERERERENGESQGKCEKDNKKREILLILSNFCCCRGEYIVHNTTADIISTRTDKSVCWRPVFFKVH